MCCVFFLATLQLFPHHILYIYFSPMLHKSFTGNDPLFTLNEEPSIYGFYHIRFKVPAS